MIKGFRGVGVFEISNPFYARCTTKRRITWLTPPSKDSDFSTNCHEQSTECQLIVSWETRLPMRLTEISNSQ